MTAETTTTMKKKKVNLCFFSLSFDGNQNLQQAYKGWIVHFWPPLASGDGDLGGQSNGQTASNLLRCCKNVRPTKQGPISRNFSMRKNNTTHSNRTLKELLSSMTSWWISFRSILIWERPVWGQVFLFIPAPRFEPKTAVIKLGCFPMSSPLVTEIRHTAGLYKCLLSKLMQLGPITSKWQYWSSMKHLFIPLWANMTESPYLWSKSVCVRQHS